jgi:hypothetical protein
MVRNNGLRQVPLNFDFSELMSNCIIWKNNFVALITKGLNFEEFMPGGLHAVAAWN